MIATHKIIRFNQDFIILNIDGNEFIIPLDKLSIRLESATDIERFVYRISPSGYGIHWPLIDEDLSIDRILRILQNNSSRNISNHFCASVVADVFNIPTTPGPVKVSAVEVARSYKILHWTGRLAKYKKGIIVRILITL